MPRVFSGIKPTGETQLGNYLGAIRHWVDSQPPARSEAAGGSDAIFCVVDLHATTVLWDPAELERLTRHHVTMLSAAGLSEDRSLLFVQSHVPAHTELTWVLNCVATFGELRRMTQFKEKAADRESVSVGLFDYPVLMAADILLYDTDEVPVGDDQRQHVELTRDLATRFNHHFGDVFAVPVATFPPVGARIMDLQDPTKKMSKSDDSPLGCVMVLDPPSTIERKIKSAVTDSGSEIRHDRDEKPGISNLIEIFAAATGTTIPDVEQRFANSGYGAFKQSVADAVVECLRPVQARFAELSADPGEVDRLIARGAARARAIAGPVLERARKAAGLLAPA
jgi:tryptophanyl-tRNA synthetase